VPESREERRLVTCVFIDIVGSTALTARLGPERLKRALTDTFEEVSAQIRAEGGVVEKYIGDAVYALFGAPTAHADDPLRALRAAHACRTSAARPESPFTLRIGVETGEAVVDLAAVEVTHQQMSVGAVVNTAARLEQAAEPGQILVGPACHAVTSAAARFRSLGTRALKGLDAMEVWELEAVGEAVPSVDLPFVGRRDDIDILRMAYGRSSQRPVLALVSGPPGQGKTRVVRQLLEEIDRVPLLARFRPLGESGAAAPLRGLLGGPDVGRTEVDAALAVIEDPAERDRVLRAVLHSAGLAQDEQLSRLPNEERTDEIVHAWRRYFATRGDTMPVVWLEDLHWADEATVRLVDRLTLSSGPLFLVATARPEFVQTAALRPGGDRFFVDLGPLDAGDALALAGHAGAADTFSVDRAQGNPLFIVELARMVSTGEALPLTLQGALGARLDELMPADRELLSHASIIGEAFSVSDAAFLSGRDAADVASTLARLADLLYLRRQGGTFQFHHNLLRDVAYGRLLVADRMRLHARLASERGDLDPDVQAHHWWEALRPPDAEWVWPELEERAGLQRAALATHLAAAERHRAAHDGWRAIAILERAAQLAQDGADTALVDRAWGRAAAMEGSWDVSWDCFARAVAFHRVHGGVPPDLYFDWLQIPVWYAGPFPQRPDDNELRDLIAEGEAAASARRDVATLARLQMLRAQLDDDLVLVAQAVDAASGVLGAADLAAMLARLAQIQFEHADLDAMAVSAERLREISDRIADPDVAFATRRRVAIWRGDLAEARRLALEFDVATRPAGPHIRSHALGTLSWQAEFAGDWTEVRRIASETLSLMRAHEGTRFCGFAGTALASAALVEIREGNVDEARALLGAAQTTDDHAGTWREAYAALGDRRAVAQAPLGSAPHQWAVYATACVIAGEREGARAAAERLEAMAARGAWLAGAIGEAVRDEIEGRGRDGPGHQRLRERGYVGTSQILSMRAPRG